MQDVANSKIAVFIDFENVALSADKQFDDFDLGLILKAVQKRGRVTIKRAYGDWSRLSRYRDALRENAVELVQLYSYPQQQGGKNRADIRLVIDVMECLFTLEYIDTIVIVSGDSDFSSLMSKSREYGKYTIGVGVKASTSDLLTKSCDEFLFYDELLETSYQAIRTRREETVSEAAPEAPAEVAPPPAIIEKTTQKPAPPPAPPPPVVKRTPPPITVISHSTLPPAAPPVNYSERDALQYFFEDIRLPLLPADVRQKTLADLLEAAAPGKTLNQVINAVKVKYDYGNVYGKREDIRLVAKLACRAGVFDFGKERPSLAAYLRRVVVNDSKQAAALTDEALLRISLEANFPLTLKGAAQTFFPSDEGRCEELLDQMTAQGVVERTGDSYRLKMTDTINRLLQAPELAAVKRDLDGVLFTPQEEITHAKADDLLTRASELRRDFSASSQLGLRGLRMLTHLYQRREKGLGVDEFLWRTATCCTARAGVSFHNHDYFTARQHYLAFFWILQEGEMAWEMLRSLTPHMLSYYWMTLSHELDFYVTSFSGQSPPSETVMAIVHALNSGAQEKLTQLAYNLAVVNAGQLRSLIEQLETELSAPEQQTALALLKAGHERFLAG